jgi:hypothetical protein
MSFGVSDKEMSATIEKMEGGKKIQSLLISNEPSYIVFTNIIKCFRVMYLQSQAFVVLNTSMTYLTPDLIRP